ncbi:hypothetical protein KIN34_12935 [Cellulomonas sp. DKR-3]|uniref:Uncharacterized protein n=1 Tax=Cellulomonas fulva TaxID=2835530 RepID=A0ABS5U1A6_9CELL|nr:hypothetical protein [Cellulomonas fulva]MBT0995188.1 hypothetical protein [Cellulomonas fulva]
MDDVLDVLVVVLALAVSAGLGWLVVAGVLRLASRSGDAGTTSTAAPPALDPSATSPSAAGAASPAPTSAGKPSVAAGAAGPTATTAVPTAPAAPAGAGDPQSADPAPPVLSVAGSSDGPDGPRAKAVLRGGTWIGILERLAVTGCVLLGQVEGVAIVVAVKGLGRYPELRENPGVSERFVIGTLASLVWAVAIGVVGRLLIT